MFIQLLPVCMECKGTQKLLCVCVCERYRYLRVHVRIRIHICETCTAHETVFILLDEDECNVFTTFYASLS